MQSRTASVKTTLSVASIPRVVGALYLNDVSLHLLALAFASFIDDGLASIRNCRCVCLYVCVLVTLMY